ncbi:endonuclease-reverse transcriptase, partial [Brachionus plicatilis]
CSPANEIVNLQEKRNVIKQAYCNAADATLAYQSGSRREWISNETWTKIKERSDLKAKLLRSKSERIKTMIEKEYSSKNKDVKKSARRDRRAFIDQMAKIADEAAERGDLSETFKITNHLCGTRTKVALVKDKEGKTLSTIQEQASEIF